MTDIESQVSWSLAQIRENGQQLLAEAGFSEEAKLLDQEMVGTATDSIIAHLEEEGDLIAKAIDQGLIAV